MADLVDPDPESFSPVRALAKLLGFAAVGAAVAAGYLIFDWGLPCPLLTVTGIQCPFCGSTRAVGALLAGDLAAAWQFNALLVLAIPLLAACALVWIVEALGGPAVRPPVAWRPMTQTRVYWIVSVVCVVFMVVRNLV